MVYKNAEKLAAKYGEIISKIYIEEADAAFQNFKKEASELIEKFADKDENGHVKRDARGQILITEQVEEFKKANEKFAADNKAMLDARQVKINESMKYLELTNEFSLLTIALSDFPNDVTPGIVGIFAEV